MNDLPEPRFVDAHVHIKDAVGLEDLRTAGITAVRDAGTRSKAGLALASSPLRGAPLVISAGRALYKKGGYGSAFGIPAEGINDIRREIVMLKNEGAGIIKAMASGIVSLAVKDAITPGGFSREELAALVREAKAQGLAVMAHANGEEAILTAAEAGVRSIEHGFFMTPRALDAVANHGVFWVPTIGALERAAAASKASAEMKAYVRNLICRHLDMIAQAHARGISLAAGTDCVLPDRGYGKAYQAELAYFEEAGLSSRAVMEIACDNGAKLMGMQ